MNQFKLTSLITESSLSRVFQFIEDGSRDFGMISASRHEYGPEENEQRHLQLKRAVRDAGLGYIETRGGFVEDGEIEVQEKSLFVPNIDRDTIERLGSDFEQDSVLYKGEGGFSELGTRGKNKGKTLTTFKQGKGKDNLQLGKEAVKKFFSSLAKGSHRGKKFVFTSKSSEEEEQDRRVNLDQRIMNPVTGRKIKVKSALSYGERHPAYQKAKKIVFKMDELETMSVNRGYSLKRFPRQWINVINEECE